MPAGAAAPKTTSLSITLDGKPLALSDQPIISKNQVLFPLAALTKALKLNTVVSKNIINVKRNGKVYKTVLNQPKMWIDTKLISLQQASVNQSGKIYVPERFVELVLDTDVTYDAKSRKIAIGLTEQSKKALIRSLFEAARVGDIATIKNLLGRGVDPNATLPEYYSTAIPLYLAVQYNRVEAAKALLDAGASLGTNGEMYARIAITLGSEELLRILLDAGVDPNSATHDSLLEWASTKSTSPPGSENTVPPKPELVQLLLKYGADPGLDHSLIRAVQSSSFNIIQQLLHAGADKMKPDDSGLTPYQASVDRGIQSWLNLQTIQPEIPHFSIVDSSGATVPNGVFQIRNESNLQLIYPGYSWSDGVVYLDVPDGNYQLIHIATSKMMVVQPFAMRITVKDGSVVSPTLTLPEPNVKGKVSLGDVPFTKGGMIGLARNGNYLPFPFTGDTFELALEPGQYRAIGFRTFPDNINYKIDQAFQISGTSGMQEITFSVTN
ncbi:ankyrin repeat domain-containing protein [Cohnella soli]|uniref:Ankyrin repeat domain-containing protein n=1 Tax=Cohnella soli TaxID=425005 RepID=A0ABW0HNM4_9BACL